MAYHDITSSGLTVIHKANNTPTDLKYSPTVVHSVVIYLPEERAVNVEFTGDFKHSGKSNNGTINFSGVVGHACHVARKSAATEGGLTSATLVYDDNATGGSNIYDLTDHYDQLNLDALWLLPEGFHDIQVISRCHTDLLKTYPAYTVSQADADHLGVVKLLVEGVNGRNTFEINIYPTSTVFIDANYEPPPPPGDFISATGGTVTTSGDYKYHAFASNGTFEIVSLGDVANNLVEYLVVGAGAGGAYVGTYSEGAGGGGAGQKINDSFTASSTGTMAVVVGAKGAGRAASYGAGTDGGSSSFNSDTAVGGGAGAVGFVGNGGASGGGGGADSTNRAGGSATAGYAGGNGFGSGTTANRAGGGGGGSGSVGTNGTTGVGGNGGIGYSWLNGATYAYGGGGSTLGAVQGASPGGGNASKTASGGNATVPGSGGGACSSTNAAHKGGDGADGIVVVRYKFQ